MKRFMNVFNVLLVVGIGLFSGCIAVDCGYTENEDPITVAADEDAKVAVTYSLDFGETWESLYGAPSRESLSKKVRAGLERCGLFSSVEEVADDSTDYYHITFKFYEAYMTEGRDEGVNTTAKYTLCLVPTWDEASLDGAATVYLRGKPIYSTARAEKYRTIIWLPLAPIGVVCNCWMGWHFVEKGVINGVINDVVKFHQQRFGGEK